MGAQNLLYPRTGMFSRDMGKILWAVRHTLIAAETQLRKELKELKSWNSNSL